MQITLYQRSYPVKDAPVALSFVPFSPAQRHTYTHGDKVYEAVRKEVHIIVPEGVKIDTLKNLLCWVGEKGPMKSTANEVFEFARAKLSGFRAVA